MTEPEILTKSRATDMRTSCSRCWHWIPPQQQNLMGWCHHPALDRTRVAPTNAQCAAFSSIYGSRSPER